ncbi:MAG: protein kinase [Gemmatimonadaceae bacterium]|nr:protein kinase [Gemmatimonadaceae bacterium]
MSDHLREQLQANFGAAYALQRELGGGGMSRVFVARDEALGRDVVITVITADLAEGVSAERFTREVKLAARLQQANIVPVLMAGTANGIPYYTMPFVKGESLRARMANGQRLAIGESTGILRDMARALAYAHAEGVVHRDIKPENILLSGGAAVVTDFGIAKAMSASRTQDGAASGALTQAGMSLGTPAYMAPEQALSDPSTDHRADLYAWGVIAYELLSGAHMFADRTTTHALIAAHVSDTPKALHAVNAQVPAALSALVMRTLEKDPARRPQSAGELLTALESLGHQPVAAHASATAITSNSRSKTAVRTSVAAIAVLAVVAMAWLARRGTSSAVALERSVIVLPFENASRDTAQEYFADGLTDELIGRLAAAGLRVTGRNTAFAYKGKHPTPGEVGKVAHVATVLSGQVRRLGEQFRVTAELASATNDSVMWSFTTKDSRTADAFALQRAMVDSIIARFQLAPRAIAAGEATDASVSAQAHDYALRGRFFGNQLTQAGSTAAIAFYDSALALAPRYLDAHLGKVQVLLSVGDGYESPRTVLPRVQAILATAAGIDSSRGDYWATQSLLTANWIWDWPKVRSDAARARAIEPSNFAALFALALARGAGGDGPGALATLDTAQRSDPLSPYPQWARFFIYSVAGMRDSTQAVWQRLPDPLRYGTYGDVGEGIAMLALDRNADAERAFREGEGALGYPSPLRVAALARLGRTAEARAQLKLVEQAFGKTYIGPEFIAAAAAELGDTTMMYRWLDRGQRDHSGFAVFLGYWNHPFTAHKQEPHFQRILKQMGLKPVTIGSQPRS